MSFSALENLIAKSGGYDLQENDLGLVAIESWAGFPTRKFSYSKTDANGVKKESIAVMLNPTPNQVARWIVNSVTTVCGRYVEDFGRQMVRHIVIASGFQFLVRGIHLEDMGGTGKHTYYPFFDGVTVKLDSIADGWPTRLLDPAEIESTVTAEQGNVTQVGKYARIQSTTRQEYLDAGGTQEVSNEKWLGVVRQLYQAAWGNDDNKLMVATTRAKKKEWGF
ncbi:hypothetical protein O8B93_06715 [Agrobacterium rhizogenes]|uniref:hypothetical protein n=1 Tax=Rhizobium rhizogenes TaxID=359 RepID=UPI0022B74DD5|nr:hypothetical protein [Rhizobium rhizogenes]MCZ7447277.1 hypothetical protein [Rhizobium rhizogenes]